jgi:hypothetical protein
MSVSFASIWLPTQWVPRAFSPGESLPVHEDDHSPPSSAGGKNEWSCTATSTTCLQRVYSDKFYTFTSTENPPQHVLHSIFTCQHTCRIRGQYLTCTDCIFGTMYFLYALLGRRNLWCAVRKNSGKQWAKTGRVNFNPQEDHTIIGNDSPKGGTSVCVCVCACARLCTYIYIYRSRSEVNTKLFL